jgi:hypothetical protein
LADPLRTESVDHDVAIPPIGHRVVRRIAAALLYRDFRVLWLGSCASSIGTWMQSLAENWLVFSVTGSA